MPKNNDRKIGAKFNCFSIHYTEYYTLTDIILYTKPFPTINCLTRIFQLMVVVKVSMAIPYPNEITGTYLTIYTLHSHFTMTAT